MRRTWITAKALSLAGMLLASGCSSFDPAAPLRSREIWYPEPIPESWWPSRVTTDLEQAIEAAPLVLRARPSDVPEELAEDSEVVTRHPYVRVATAMPFGQGVVRVLRPSDREGRLSQADQLPQFEFTSITDSSRPLANAVTGELFELMEPRGEPRGLVVGLAGAGAAQELWEELRERGYAVLKSELRRVVREPVTVHILSDRDLDPAAREIARAVDDRLAEKAYAVEALLSYLAARRPDLPSRPLVLTGLGLGAAAIPVVAARLGRRIDATVLVGSGANLLEICLTGDLKDGGIEVISPDGELSLEAFNWLSDLYLAESHLDPFHTSRFLGRSPVLMLQARFDEVVPAWTGELLFQRLGRPDRVRYLGDHDDILDEAASQADWIGDWVDRATENR